MTQPAPFPTFTLPPFYTAAYPNQTSGDPTSPNYYATYTGASTIRPLALGLGDAKNLQDGAIWVESRHTCHVVARKWDLQACSHALLVSLRAQQVNCPVRKCIRHSRVSLVKHKSSVEARCL